MDIFQINEFFGHYPTPLLYNSTNIHKTVQNVNGISEKKAEILEGMKCESENL